MANILVGTASWTDKSLIACKRFYPPNVSSAEDRLRFYASQFPIVEVDSSYYAMPSVGNSQLWAERTPPGFVFNMKAFRALTTHQTPHVALPPDLRLLVDPKGKPNVYAKDLPAEVWEELWRRFVLALQPLRDAGKLGALHFQFPPWFVTKRDSYAYLDEVRQRLADYTVAIEFRHKSWFNPATQDATLAFERERGFVNVIVDEPQGSANSIPSVWEVTNSNLAIVRLHGRNQATWNIKGATAASDRFNYDYGQEELEGLAAPIRDVASQTLMTHVIFNNNYEDQGPRNGAALRKILAV
jgi:uncharacterized protein YecE (DUF72 family)